MKKEHIVHFKVMRGTSTERMRGLVYLEENEQLTSRHFEQCLKQCGFEVRLANKEQFIYKPVDPSEDYTIDVLENYGRQNADLQGDYLARSFMKPNRPI
ncbi:hypothetical protein [Paenibacillus harenae]|uniref:Uncharacterized protein n=1 Tax=Paenibacillus harenae TaxID=306543 RepID=A0ABT9U6V7_PAEHA|nr:hypothetical protein [Paenibacillus harenae]MDQ0114758.1 hypothetical protein [Paenibacillus harenae]